MDDELVTLARFDWLMQANLVRSRLAAADIESVLLDQYTLSLFPHWGMALDGIRLQVTSEDLDDARAILNEHPLAAVEPISSDHERATGRALRSAVFGVVQPLLLLWACWLLLPVLGWRQLLTVRDQRNVALAAALILVYGVLPALLYALLARP